MLQEGQKQPPGIRAMISAPVGEGSLPPGRNLRGQPLYSFSSQAYTETLP